MRNILRFVAVLALALLPTVAAQSQVVIGREVEYDIDYLTPKTYEIGGISYEGADNFVTL